MMQRSPLATRHFLPSWALATAGLLLCGAAHATVIFDNYRGQANLPPGSSAQAPNYANNAGNNSLTNLINLAAGGPANIANSGTHDDINWPSSEQELCNKQVNNSACADQVMGRVIYALVRMPTAGAYTFKANHDDDLQVDFSTNFSAATAANYRNFDYNVPVGGLAAWTSASAFPNVPGSFVAPTANSCYVMRLYWNNRGDVNFLRLKWVTPEGTEEFIPAANLYDPSMPESYANCTQIPTDVGVQKTAPAQFTPGGPLDYTITVWNYGPAATSAIPVADLLPDSVTYTGSPSCTASGTAACGTATNNGQAWLLTTGDLPVNTSAGNAATAPTQGSFLTYKFTVTTKATALSIENTATITANDLNPDNNTSTVISQSSGKVSVSKTGPAKVAMGQAFDYQFTVSNGLGTAVAAAIVAEQLPANMQAQSASGATCTPMPSAAGALLSCTLSSSIAAGGTGSFSIKAVATGTGVVTNYASTDPNGGSNKGTPGPNCDATKYSCTSAKTEVIAPAVTVSKSFAPTTIGAGGSSLLTVIVSNAASTITLNNLSLTDILPSNVTTTGTQIGNSCDGDLSAPGNTQLVLTGGTLAAGASCQLQWMVTSTVPGTYVNTIAAGNVGSAEGATNTAPAQASLVVTAPADLGTVKTLAMVNGAPNQGQKLRNGDVLVYHITVTNKGGTAASTTLTETVPNGARYTGSGEGWSTSPACTTEASTCTQTVTVAPGATVTTPFTMTITPPVLTPTLVNSVTTSTGDCNSCTVSSPGVYADMVATPAHSQEVKKGDIVTVVTYCGNKGPDYGVNATCTVTGAPAGASTVCTPVQPVAQFQVGDVFTCTTTFKAEKSGSVMLVTTAKSTTRDPNAKNNVATSPVTVIEPEVTPPAEPTPVPVDSRWMLLLTALAVALLAARQRQNKA